MSTCGSCDAPIRWALTVNGKRIPLDAEPVADGNIVLRSGIAHIEKTAALDLDGGGARYVSHFATCPNSQQHRRRR